jgi:uncharacterized protein
MGLLHARRAVDETWEMLCNGCGLCCCERSRIAAGVRVDLRQSCPYLDGGNQRCRVYDRRFKVESRCRKVNILHALFGRRMPLTCGYVQRYRRWVHG